MMLVKSPWGISFTFWHTCLNKADGIFATSFFPGPASICNGSACYCAVHEADQGVWIMLWKGVKLPCGHIKDK